MKTFLIKEEELYPWTTITKEYIIEALSEDKALEFLNSNSQTEIKEIKTWVK